MRRLAITFSALAVAAGAIGVGSPAQAATLPVIDAACSGGDLVFSSNNIAAVVGDVIQVRNLLSAGTLMRTGFSNVSGSGTIANPGTNSYTVASAGAGDITFQAGAGSTCANASATLSFSPTGGGGGDSSRSAPSGPAAIAQEFGLPASGTCDSAASKELNWAGVASGGWGISWAQWMNGGKGGVVCTRTLAYNTVSGAWAVRS